MFKYILQSGAPFSMYKLGGGVLFLCAALVPHCDLYIIDSGSGSKIVVIYTVLDPIMVNRGAGSLMPLSVDTVETSENYARVRSDRRHGFHIHTVATNASDCAIS